MTALDHAIANLEQLLRCFVRDGKQQDALKVSYELLGYQDVRDGVPRWLREMDLHHAELRGLYCAARADAEALGGDAGRKGITAMTKRTLVERCIERADVLPSLHVRAELRRVARQVRRIRAEVNGKNCVFDSGYRLALTDVLDLLKEARR